MFLRPWAETALPKTNVCALVMNFSLNSADPHTPKIKGSSPRRHRSNTLHPGVLLRLNAEWGRHLNHSMGCYCCRVLGRVRAVTNWHLSRRSGAVSDTEWIPILLPKSQVFRSKISSQHKKHHFCSTPFNLLLGGWINSRFLYAERLHLFMNVGVSYNIWAAVKEQQLEKCAFQRRARLTIRLHDCSQPKQRFGSPESLGAFRHSLPACEKACDNHIQPWRYFKPQMASVISQHMGARKAP